MAETFVPRLQLNGSRHSAPGADVTGTWLDRTAAPHTAPAWRDVMSGRVDHEAAANEAHTRHRSSYLSAGSDTGGSGSNNNSASMLNHTSNGDWMRHSYTSTGDGGGGDAAGGGAAAPPSPTPRLTRSDARDGGDGGWRRFTDLHSGTDSGSRGPAAPSATRPLFTVSSSSASPPHNRNVIAGDTGRVAWGSSSSTAGGPAEPAARRFSSARSRAPGASGGAAHDGATRWGHHTSGPPPSSSHRSAFTTTYVSTSTGAMPFSRQGRHGGGGGIAAGLVDSRSRARSDRWTDAEEEEEPWGAATDNEDMGRRGSTTTTPTTESWSSSSSSSSASSEERYSSRRPRHRSRRRRSHHRRRDERESDDAYNSDSDEAADGWGGADSLSFANAMISAIDAQPVVPLELLRASQEQPFIWNRHPSHGIILCLLQHRGIYLPRYRELVDYHMAELLLHYLDLCREGAFFVYYAAGKWPKERFLRLRMLPVNRLEAETELVPHLVITLHESGVQILDAVPLDNLVGVTVTPQAACFRPFLESPNTIIGCREGRGHRARLPVDGAFSLWFYDVARHTSRSVDILTCDAKVFDIWTKTFRGLVSVNSSSVVQVALTPSGESAELVGRAQAAQQQGEVDHGERRGKCRGA
ncbi:hypothetical protein NESM_000199500 [Novymonas esmeraldas]|uniref:PH-like domain-containing protein n=1 Tax=Novymonas esmeraldas TaxID=1808958 RepID=A0AAW0F7Q1_9TRYP